MIRIRFDDGRVRVVVLWDFSRTFPCLHCVCPLWMALSPGVLCERRRQSELPWVGGLLNCINCNPVPLGTGNHSHGALWNSDLTFGWLGDPIGSGGIALNGVSAKVQPLWLIQPGRK